MDITNIIVGAHATFKIGPWVTAKAAGTLVEVGATAGGVTLDPKMTPHLVSIDQRLGDVMAVPVKREMDMKLRLLEGSIDNWVTAFGQPVANKTGTTPNWTLLVDPSAGELYYQTELKGKGLGTTKVRTITTWRNYIKELTAIPFKKDGEQGLEITLGVLEETSGTGADNWFKLVET